MNWADLGALFTPTEKTKLAGIEAAATKYPDTGEQAFLDADHTKLDGVETGADVTDRENVETSGGVLSLSKHFDYEDLNTGSSVEMGAIPAHSYVIRTQIHVVTGFNASGTDVCEIGYVGDPNAYGTETNIETSGIKNPPVGAVVGYSAAARTATLRARAGLSTDATVGAGIVIIEYILVGE